MNAFRAITAASLVLSLLTAPLAGALLPCCCSGPPASVKCPVCRGAEAAAKVVPGSALAGCNSGSHHSCCEAKRTIATASAKPSSCTCVKSLPATTLARDSITPASLQQLWLATQVRSSIDPIVFSNRNFVATDDVRTPTGPPLLALYCTWLK